MVRLNQFPLFSKQGLVAVVIALVIPACGDDDPVGPGNGGNQGGAGDPPTAVIVANPTTVPAGDGGATVVTLDGSQSTDPEGEMLTFSWNVAGVQAFVGGTSATSEVAMVTFPGAAPYQVTLTVRDVDGNTDSATVTIQLGG